MAARIRAGKLRHKITIQQVTETQDSFGGITSTWATFGTRRAQIEPLVGREYFDAQQTNAELSIKFRIRYLSGVTPKMRVSWDSRTFDIESVINVEERDKEMILMCSEAI